MGNSSWRRWARRLAVPAVAVLGLAVWALLPSSSDDPGGGDGATAIAGEWDPDALGRTDVARRKPNDGCERGSYDTAAGASTAFGLNLFRDVTAAKAAGANVVLSPLSLTVAFQMLANGADDGVWQELLPAMCLHAKSTDEANQETADLMAALAEPDNGVEITAANAIWTAEKMSTSRGFDAAMAEWFDAERRGFDPSDAAGTADDVNKWAADKTKDRITKVLSPDDIRESLVMLLANAVTFDGQWQAEFDEDATQDAKFTLANGKKRDVKMMVDEFDADFHWYGNEDTGEGVSLARLPYGKTGRFGATIIVPDNQQKMDDFISKLTAERWQQLRKAMKTSSVTVMMPRMRVDTLEDLTDTLFGLGVPKSTYNSLFDPPPPEPVLIEWVKQADMLQMDESGTKAAAVTVIGAGIAAGFDSGPVVRADRPYVIVIDDDKTGAVLFVARIADPGDGSNVTADA